MKTHFEVAATAVLAAMLSCAWPAFAAGDAAAAAADAAPAQGLTAGWQMNPAQQYLQLNWAYGPQRRETVMSRVQYGLTLELAHGEDLLLRSETRSNFYFDKDHQALARGRRQAAHTEVRDFFVQKNLGRSTFRLGRQFINWSEMEALGFLSDINPRDFNEFVYPSTTDSSITESRLSVEHFGEDGRLTAFFTPRARGHIEARPGSRYDLEAQIFDASQFSIEPRRENKSEWGARYLMSSERADIALIAARLVSNDGLYSAQGEQGGRVQLLKRHESYGLLGLSANRSFGRWTLRTELGLEKGRKYQVAPERFAVDSEPLSRDQRNVVLSLEYMDASNTLYHVELAERRIQGWTPEIGQPRSKHEFFFLYRTNLLRNLLDVEYTYYRDMGAGLGIHRGKFAYEIDDRTRLTLQLDRFQVPRRDVLPLQDMDRAALFLQHMF